jgi:hypothetical protein
MSLIYGVPDCQPIRGFSANVSSSSSPLTDEPSAASGVSIDGIDENDVIGGRYENNIPHGYGDVMANLSGANDELEHGQDHHHLYGYHGSHGYMFQVSRYSR